MKNIKNFIEFILRYTAENNDKLQDVSLKEENESIEEEQDITEYKEEETENIEYKESVINEDNSAINDEQPELDTSKITYHFPPCNLLAKGKNSPYSIDELKESASRLQQLLEIYGVKGTMTEVSQGPSVTIYEFQPELGVRVNKIIGLANDIKLNMAATDIYIEATIPGKSAIGIEIPNKEKSIVTLRDLLESKEFKEFSSNLAFAVGRDMYGRIIISDIAKMPHMLIAGATGSGKSVFINSIIMSILYKARPDDVRMIMIDTKGVSLSPYNGIPHLLIPVVTDSKKAIAALSWCISEIKERYNKFSEYNVRDLNEYNKKVKSLSDETNIIPQILVVIDDLSDLMAVNPNETEDNIVRIAQISRAAGVYLVIATQRPSTDIITGLIKANIPSRVSFDVFSAIDSRVILDEKGAEKLSGNGEMLFKPLGYPRPVKVQGAYISDKEIDCVIDFCRHQMIGNMYTNEVEERIKNVGNNTDVDKNNLEQYFVEAGRLVIEKDKASIGMLQRVFKIGFNRAARIMDELCEMNVVGEEEGTRPRKILMNMDQFEELVKNLYRE